MRTASQPPGIIPLKMSAHTLSIDQFDAEWTLADFSGEADPPPKRVQRWIAFDAPFSNVPLVHVGLVGFDIDHRDTARIRLWAERITANGFVLMIETWRHTRVYGIEVSWLALGHE